MLKQKNKNSFYAASTYSILDFFFFFFKCEAFTDLSFINLFTLNWILLNVAELLLLIVINMVEKCLGLRPLFKM